MSSKGTLLRTAVRSLALVALVGCGSTPTTQEDPVPTSMTVTASPVTLTFLTESVALLAQVLDQNGAVMSGQAVTWTVADASVATVSATGSVQAVANGSTRVTATSGSLTGDIDIVVAQAVAGLFIVSGNNQEAIRDSTLANPLVVRAQDLGGAGVAGIAIAFAPEAGDGSVSADTVTTAANGEAQVSWTLGSEFGPQRVNATSAALAVQFRATARAEVPTPDLAVTAPLTVVRPDPSSLETFVARTTIKNEGDASSGVTTRVALLAGAVEVATFDLAALAPNAEQAIEIAVSPVAAGQYTLRAVADADDAIVELNEENNEATRSVTILQQTAANVGTISNLSAAADAELLFRFEVPAGPPTTLTVSTAGANGDIDLYIDEGTRAGARGSYFTCVSAGPTSNESCQIPLASGTYHILMHAWVDATIPAGGPFSNASLTIALGGSVQPFDIEVVILDSGTPSQDAAFLSAAAQFMTAVIGDIPDYAFSPGNPYPAGTCATGQPEVSGTIDDVRIYVVIDSIDGPGNVLGQAGPCVARLQGHPILGRMQFDQADLNTLESNGLLNDVILHEMGHVLGIGTLWESRGFLRNKSNGNSAIDTYFNGERAIAAFDAAGGAGYVGNKVPVANTGGTGSADGHWREAVLGNELMTPTVNSGNNPFSAITIESLADMGYAVDVSVADAYSLPTPAPPRAIAEERASAFDLTGDLYRGPVWIYDEKGRLVGVLR